RQVCRRSGADSGAASPYPAQKPGDQGNGAGFRGARLQRIGPAARSPSDGRRSALGVRFARDHAHAEEEEMISSIWVHNLVAYSLQVALMVGSEPLLHLLFRPRISPATLAYWQALVVACLLLPLCQPWKASGSASLTVQATVLSTAERAAATFTNLSP